ncbi:MAG TPA: SDR family oxidoreductase [Microthrixaceae bacterium]|nr:SDR family oxidoreductase [Microthrixaceae bacterium]
MDLSLDGRVALVTGASKGIGRAIATAFAEAGAMVMISSRKQDALEEARATMPAEVRADVEVFAANAGNLESAAACVHATIERFGGLDILVNNAATNPYMGPTIDIDPSRFDKTTEVNMRAPLFWSQHAWHARMEDHGGSILNIASIGGLSVETSIGNYNVTKAALIHQTRTLAKELGPSVRVNAIAPGLVKTDMARALWERNEAAVAAAVPLARLGEPEDIANAAVFLSSDAASWITGVTLVVDAACSSDLASDRGPGRAEQRIHLVEASLTPAEGEVRHDDLGRARLGPLRHHLAEPLGPAGHHGARSDGLRQSTRRRLILGDVDDGLHRPGDRGSVTADRLAMPVEHRAALSQRVGRGPHVPLLGMAGDDAEHAVSLAADQYRQRCLHRLGLALGVEHPVVRTLERGPRVGQQARHDRHGLTEA